MSLSRSHRDRGADAAVRLGLLTALILLWGGAEARSKRQQRQRGQRLLG